MPPRPARARRSARDPLRLAAKAVLALVVPVAGVALLLDSLGSDHHAASTAVPAAVIAATQQLRAAPSTPSDPRVGAAPADAADSMAAGTSPPATVSGLAADHPAVATAGREQPTAARGTAEERAAAKARAAKKARAAERAKAARKAKAAKQAKAERVARAAARERAARKARAALRRGVTPAGATRSHYLRHLTGVVAVDAPRMRTLGAADGRANASGQQHIVLLDIGGQLGDGVLLSATTRWVSYDALAQDLIAYVQGYHSQQRRAAPVTVAIGTNNDLQTTARTGGQWATRVVDPVRTATAHYRHFRVTGAIDMEPGFKAGPKHSRAWVSGFLGATRAPLVFNGSADGCSAVIAGSRCQHGWTAADLAWVAGAAAPKRISALPQVYNPTMAGQWAMISLTAVRDGAPPLRFRGPLTENAACRGKRRCPTMGNVAAWNALWHSLHQVVPALLPARTDLDVQ